MCYYRVEAIVTGTPEPEIEFDEGDNISPLGTGRVEVAIDMGESYTLTATATNDSGTSNASIALSGECSKEIAEEVTEEESEEEVTEEEVEEEATSSGSSDISGYIYYNNIDGTYTIENTWDVYIGDTDLDTQIKGYLSFDISGLHGKTVQDAHINFRDITRANGMPEEFASAIVVDVFNYVRLDFTDYYREGGVHLVDIPISADSYTISGNTLRNELQDVLDKEVRDYFQLRLYLDSATDNDGSRDCMEIPSDDVHLHINYTD